MFKFDNEDDHSLVLKNSPSSIMGNLLVIQPLEIGKAISKMDFTHCLFWGQVHGLPMEKMTCPNGQIIAGNIGKLIRVEAPNEGLSLSRSFLRIRVEMDVSLPLPKGFMFKRQTQNSYEIKETWVHFKYERLSDYCYARGRIGHHYKACKLVYREEGNHSGYGPELRTGVAKNLGLLVEFYRAQIDEMEESLQPILRQRQDQAPAHEEVTHVRFSKGQTSSLGHGVTSVLRPDTYNRATWCAPTVTTWQ